MTKNEPITLTLFNYERLDLMDNEPTRFILNNSTELNIFKTFVELPDEISKLLRSEARDAKDSLGKTAAAVLNELLGPWCAFFCGKAKNSFAKFFEKNIFGQVDQMCGDSKEK